MINTFTKKNNKEQVDLGIEPAAVKKYKKAQKAYAEKGAVALYQEYVVGGKSFWNLIKHELFINFTAGIPGALGLLIRKILYPRMISQFGKGIVWGKDMVLRYPQKIRIQDHCIFDDGCVLDAKGENNQGIFIGSSCMFGRQTILANQETMGPLAKFCP